MIVNEKNCGLEYDKSTYNKGNVQNQTNGWIDR